MKQLPLASVLFLSSALASQAIVIEFDLSPLGTSPGVGLSPLNEVIPGNSSGSGNEIGSGIRFDTDSLMLSLSIGYGSSAGFTDLTGAAFAFFLHGPATTSETAPVLYNLGSLHSFASDPTRGGTIIGSLALASQDVSGLMSGLDYINIYTTANLGGEIRGQLVAVNAPVPDSGMGTFGMLAGAVSVLAILRRRWPLKA